MVGEIGRPHGVRGLVRLRAFTEDPAAIAAYGAADRRGRREALRHHAARAATSAAIEGVADRDAAQRLTGTKLYVERDRLPPPEEEEFYLADLIGLAAVTEAGEALGRVARGARTMAPAPSWIDRGRGARAPAALHPRGGAGGGRRRRARRGGAAARRSSVPAAGRGRRTRHDAA